MKNGEFDNRTDEELFELIWKANQLEEDFDPNFDYLPVLDNKVWYNCKISIDETTDSYLIAMLEKAGAIKFLWKGLRNPCPTYNINKLFDITVERNFIIQTMEECLEAIIHDYPGLP